jgi:hypothetical protein
MINKYKKEYWSNTPSKQKGRNHIHIRLLGDSKTICGFNVTDEFCVFENKNKWEKCDKENVNKHLCLRCKKIYENLGDPRDENITKSLKTISKKYEIQFKPNQENEIQESDEEILNKLLKEIQNYGDKIVKKTMQDLLNAKEIDQFIILRKLNNIKKITDLAKSI